MSKHPLEQPIVGPKIPKITEELRSVKGNTIAELNQLHEQFENQESLNNAIETLFKLLNTRWEWRDDKGKYMDKTFENFEVKMAFRESEIKKFKVVIENPGFTNGRRDIKKGFAITITLGGKPPLSQVYESQEAFLTPPSFEPLNNTENWTQFVYSLCKKVLHQYTRPYSYE